MVLHQGKIAEMRTGEGKTLVATLPVYLNALTGKGVHVVTVNDYLAQRDAEWMGRIYRFLGLTVGVIVHGLDDERAPARPMPRDITYGTNNEFGFDYLRDNMKYRAGGDGPARPSTSPSSTRSTRILIDEARTPLIISGPTEDSSELYRRVDDGGHAAGRGHDDLREGREAAHRHPDRGGVGDGRGDAARRRALLEERQTSTTSDNVTLVHHVNQALRAHMLFARDVDYIVSDGKVIIIDEFTGRMMAGRRYSDGLHQALEAKEQRRRSSPRTRPSPRSPSRTTSACTRSWPA